MNIFDITNDIQVLSKAEFALKAYGDFENQDIIFVSLTCLDLMNLSDFKSSLGLLNARYLLIYQFQNLATHKRMFQAVALSYGQTMQSYTHLFSALGSYEVEVNRGFGIHFYQKQERIQHEIIDSAGNYYLQKDVHGEFQIPSCHKKVSSEGEEVILPIQKFLNPCSKSNLILNIVSDEIRNVCFDFDFESADSFEKKVEGIGLDKAVDEILNSNFSSKYMASMLCLEMNEFIQEKKKSTNANIQRMFAYEMFSALDNLKCIENIFKSCGLIELHKLINSQFKFLIQEYGPNDVKTLESFEELLDKEDRRWLYEIRDRIHEYESLIDKAIDIIKGNDYFLKVESYFKSGLCALDYSLKSTPMQSLGHHYNIKRYEPFYEYDEIGTSEALSLNGSTYELILIRLHELKNTYSNIIKVCEEYPVVKKKYINVSQGSKHGLFLATTQVSSGELSMLTYINPDQTIERFHYISPSIVNLEYFRDRLHRFALSQIACEWNCLGIDELEILK